MPNQTFGNRMYKTGISLMGAALMLAASKANGQGTINFANNTSTKLYDCVTGLPAAAGSYRVGLYYGPVGTTQDDLEFIAIGNISPLSILAGVYTGGTVAIPGFNAGETVAVQVRAWELAYATFEEQIQAGRGRFGGSYVFNVTLGGGTQAPASLPAAGLTSFYASGWLIPSVDPNSCPEPSTIVFGIVGALGAFLVRRRRKAN